MATDVSKVTRMSRPGPLKKLKTLSQNNTPEVIRPRQFYGELFKRFKEQINSSAI